MDMVSGEAEITLKRTAGLGHDSVAECMPGIREALCSVPSTTKQ